MRGCMAVARKYSRLCCLPLMVVFMSSAAVSTARMPPSAGPVANQQSFRVQCKERWTSILTYSTASIGANS